MVPVISLPWQFLDSLLLTKRRGAGVRWRRLRNAQGYLPTRTEARLSFNSFNRDVSGEYLYK